jgi:hypothetical protein
VGEVFAEKPRGSSTLTLPGRVVRGRVEGGEPFTRFEPHGILVPREVSLDPQEMLAMSLRPDLKASMGAQVSVVGRTRTRGIARTAHSSHAASQNALLAASE